MEKTIEIDGYLNEGVYVRFDNKDILPFHSSSLFYKKIIDHTDDESIYPKIRLYLTVGAHKVESIIDIFVSEALCFEHGDDDERVYQTEIYYGYKIIKDSHYFQDEYGDICFDLEDFMDNELRDLYVFIMNGYGDEYVPMSEYESGLVVHDTDA